jgi:hypothetical protein
MQNQIARGWWRFASLATGLIGLRKLSNRCLFRYMQVL